MAVESARLRVAVASDQSLVCEAVRAALNDRGLSVSILRWAGDQVPGPRVSGARRFDVGLMISDLDRWPRVRGVASVMSSLRVPWVMLTGAARGPLWGAALEFGARTVLTSDTPLAVVHEVLAAAARGEVEPPEDAEELRASWRRVYAERQELQERVRSLTPREREVLRLLYDGDSVARIAAIFEVSPTTVRSQVKAVLRKLDVNSQLAAVAAFGHLMELETQIHHPPPTVGQR
ncbi:response regulator transcription factor [Nocardioides sp. KR10-350]|uniref:helix-turn-helix transcriptional regulator n=1 Tax=Nocardioides cheoyonin TaxID=3156615 RepID=UPI0032B50DC1